MTNMNSANRLYFLLMTMLTLLICLAILEFALRQFGFGNPPVYMYDAGKGYALKPSQNLVRRSNARVMINSLGMRSHETSSIKPPGVFRVVVFGDSVPFGGTYVDQEKVFCSLIQTRLNSTASKTKFEVLNAGVNAWGPQNVFRHIQDKGIFDADLVLIYFPWGNLRRDLSNFYIVPFWADTPSLALEEFFRHFVWMIFGNLSKKWKKIDAFSNEQCLVENIRALEGIENFCRERNTPVFFFWSEYKDVLLKEVPDPYLHDKEKLRQVFPSDLIVDMQPVFAKRPDIASLYVDPCHYSEKGHEVVAEHLTKFIASQIKTKTPEF